MTDINDKYKKIILDLEKTIEDEKELNYVKKQITELFMIFLDRLDEITDKYEDKMEELVNNQSSLNTRVKELEKTLGSIEKDIYVEENNDFEIICPYCNSEFVVEFNSELKNEIQCPDCKNIIELDWNEESEEGCCDCSSCHEHCHDEEIEETEKHEDEDDM